MWRRSAVDVDVQQALIEAARLDVLFWFNAFGWLYEPRPTPRILPFCTRPNQDKAIVALDEALGYKDAVVIKSRGEGATWIFLLLHLRRWIFDPLYSAGLVSRNEAAVDSQKDPDSLMWKLDWTLPRLPYWIRPKYGRNYGDHVLSNEENDATIVGYPATGDVASGGRKTNFTFDEHAKFPAQQQQAAMDSTQHVTESRFLVSTYKGDSGAYYEAATDPDNDVVKVVLDWKDNPTRNAGMYVMRHGVLMPWNVEDGPLVARYAKENAGNIEKLKRRGFLKEGAISSPWRDKECLRPGATPRSVAQEIDMNPRGTVSKVFDTDVLDRMAAECCQPPVFHGRLVLDKNTNALKGFIADPNGPMKLWFKPGVGLTCPFGKYVLGVDIGAGVGGEFSSNSAIVGCNTRTGEQVLEFADPGTPPIRLARVAVALCRWLNGAYLAWEANYASGFQREVMEVLGYANVFYRELKDIDIRRKTRKPGWWNASDDDKGAAFEALSLACDEGEFIPRSREMIAECGQYEWDENGSIILATGRNIKEKKRGKPHGDRAIAAAVMWIGCRDLGIGGVDKKEEIQENFPIGSPGWRFQQAQQREGARGDPWDGGGELVVSRDPWS
jgi:hypothetical protein